MNPLLRAFEAKQIHELEKSFQPKKFRAGDTLRVTVVIEENGKKWTQTSEGVCIQKVNRGIASSFVIRRLSQGGAVEMRFPLWTNYEVLRRGKVRRANLGYLRHCSRKAGRIEDLR
jgi:large subunit ribosomal protein L19